jgi:hypothetical protein
MIPTIIHNIRSSKFSILLAILLHKISTTEDLKRKLPKCHFNKSEEVKNV